MADLSYIQSTLETKIVGQNSTGSNVNYVSADTNGNMLVKDYADGSATGGTAASVSTLMGGLYNSTLPTLTTGQQAALQLDSRGNLLINSASTLPVTQNDLTATGTLTNLSSIVTLALNGINAVNVDVSGPGFVGTIYVYETYPSSSRTLGVMALNSSALASTITTNGNYRIFGIPSSRNINVAFQTYTSGSATINISASVANFFVEPMSFNASNNLTSAWLSDGSGNALSSASGSLLVKDNADGPVTPGTAANNSTLIGAQYNSTLPTLTNTQQSALQLDASGRLIAQVVGNVASGSADSGNGVKVSGVYNSTLPSLSIGARADLQTDVNGATYVSTKVPRTYSAPTTASVTTTSSVIVAANANRKGLYLSNTTSQQISLGFNGNAAVYQNGITLFPGEKFFMDEYSFSTGAVSAVTTGTTTYIGVQEIT